MTEACTEVLYLNREEPDHEEPVPFERLVESLESETRAIVVGERVDEDVYPRNAFGV